MRQRTKIILGLAIIAALASASYVWFSPLAIFARQIADADHAVVTMIGEPPVSITITGQNLRRVVGMVSSGHRDSKPYTCGAIADVKFLRATALLGQMSTCSQLMWIGRRQYRDDTRLLDSLVVNPLMEAKLEWQIRQGETK